jgi:hypothetical protein
MSHRDIEWKSMTHMACGSSALVFEARVRLCEGEEAQDVVVKERRARDDAVEDDRVRATVVRLGSCEQLEDSDMRLFLASCWWRARSGSACVSALCEAIVIYVRVDRYLCEGLRNLGELIPCLRSRALT